MRPQQPDRGVGFLEERPGSLTLHKEDLVAQGEDLRVPDSHCSHAVTGIDRTTGPFILNC